MADDGEWIWWVGSDDERYTSQCDSREEAVRMAREEYEGAHIVEAKKPAQLQLSDKFDVDRFLEDVEELVWDDHADPDGGVPVFDMTKEQKVDLANRMKSTIIEWQSAHDLTFEGFKFSAQRNEEYIPPVEDDAA